jgi:hypothetical protein
LLKLYNKVVVRVSSILCRVECVLVGNLRCCQDNHGWFIPKLLFSREVCVCVGLFLSQMGGLNWVFLTVLFIVVIGILSFWCLLRYFWWPVIVCCLLLSCVLCRFEWMVLLLLWCGRGWCGVVQSLRCVVLLYREYWKP